MTTNDSRLHARENTFMSNTITSTTGETQVFSDPAGDSLPSFWNAVGIPEEAGTDNECENIRSSLTLLPPNSPRMVAEAESMSGDRIAQLEQQIQSLQDQLEKQSRPLTPVGKRNNAKKDKTQRGVAKGRRKNKVTTKRRTKDKFSVYKEGPIDIGRMTDWSPYRHNRQDSGRDFWQREFLEVKLKTSQNARKVPADARRLCASDQAVERRGRKKGAKAVAAKIARARAAGKTALEAQAEKIADEVRAEKIANEAEKTLVIGKATNPEAKVAHGRLSRKCFPFHQISRQVIFAF